MFAHNGYWLHPANCQLFSVHVKFFAFRAKTKKFARHVFRSVKRENFGVTCTEKHCAE
ncbi:DUF1661 domain-containing protein [Porphyromonas gingivalis]|uniref:DUF1661 domain-containing protein n=1 Tax=Porphyromonas gingivalis TaxID=837 RepID=UPI0012FE1043